MLNDLGAYIRYLFDLLFVFHSASDAYCQYQVDGASNEKSSYVLSERIVVQSVH